MKTQFKRDSTQNSTKLHLDQYYTPNDVAIHCIDTAYKVIGKENITTILELLLAQVALVTISLTVKHTT